MPGSSACISSNGAVRFTATMRASSSWVTASMSATWIMPALLTRCSTGRAAASAVAAAAVAAASPRSTDWKRSPGNAASGGRRLKLTTSKPSCSSRATMARPMPRLPPVTNAMGVVIAR